MVALGRGGSRLPAHSYASVEAKQRKAGCRALPTCPAIARRATADGRAWSLRLSPLLANQAALIEATQRISLPAAPYAGVAGCRALQIVVLDRCGSAALYARVAGCRTFPTCRAIARRAAPAVGGEVRRGKRYNFPGQLVF